MAGKYTAYPEYKDSRVEWLGEIPEHWKLNRVKYIAMLTPKKPEIKKNKKCSFVPMEYLKTGFVRTDKTQMIYDVFDGYTYFQENDILMAKVTPCFENKNIAIAKNLVNQVGFGSSEIYVLRANKKKLTNFLYYRIQENSFMDISISNMTGAGGLKRIPSDIVKNYTLALPTGIEQQKIANFLDHETAKIDALIEKQQQLIKLLKEKRQAVISHAVTKGLNPKAPMRDSGVEWLGEVPEGWVVNNIKYILNAIGDVDHYMPKSVEKGIPYIMTGNLEELVSNINFKDCKQVSYKDYLNLSKKIKSLRGDVIMARYATIGTTSYIDIDADFLVSYSCVTIKPNILKALGLYLFYYFKSDAFLQGIKNEINTNTQGNVGVNDLKKVKVALPTLVEQSNIIEFLQTELSKLDTITDSSKAAIKLMQERRTALISAAVTGKIDLRNWQEN